LQARKIAFDPAPRLLLLAGKLLLRLLGVLGDLLLRREEFFRFVGPLPLQFAAALLVRLGVAICAISFPKLAAGSGCARSSSGCIASLSGLLAA
jgi:hypothetical protein